MADPYGNYTQGLNFLGGLALNPGALTPEQLAQLGLAKALPAPGPSMQYTNAGRLADGLNSLQYLANNYYGIPVGRP
jgi:hypothetical protein